MILTILCSPEVKSVSMELHTFDHYQMAKTQEVEVVGSKTLIHNTFHLIIIDEEKQLKDKCNLREILIKFMVEVDDASAAGDDGKDVLQIELLLPI